jgi:hypothetical protein
LPLKLGQANTLDEKNKKTAVTTVFKIPPKYNEQKMAEKEGFEPSVRIDSVRQFSKLLVSATHPLFRSNAEDKNYLTGFISATEKGSNQPL